MKVRSQIIFTLIFILFVLTAFVLSASAGDRVYMWIDKKGIRHVSDQPPESTKGIKMIGEMEHVRDSPEEIRRYQAQEKYKRAAEEARTERARAVNRVNEAYQKSYDQYKDAQKEAKLSEARQDLKSEERHQKYLDDQRRNAKTSWGNEYYDRQKKRQDEEVSEKRSKLREVENQ